jgi:hypothetical protein
MQRKSLIALKSTTELVRVIAQLVHLVVIVRSPSDIVFLKDRPRSTLPRPRDGRERAAVREGAEVLRDIKVQRGQRAVRGVQLDVELDWRVEYDGDRALARDGEGARAWSGRGATRVSGEGRIWCGLDECYIRAITANY